MQNSKQTGDFHFILMQFHYRFLKVRVQLKLCTVVKKGNCIYKSPSVKAHGPQHLRDMWRNRARESSSYEFKFNKQQEVIRVSLLCSISIFECRTIITILYFWCGPMSFACWFLHDTKNCIYIFLFFQSMSIFKNIFEEFYYLYDVIDTGTSTFTDKSKCILNTEPIKKHYRIFDDRYRWRYLLCKVDLDSDMHTNTNKRILRSHTHRIKPQSLEFSSETVAEYMRQCFQYDCTRLISLDYCQIKRIRHLIVLLHVKIDCIINNSFGR